MLIIVPAKIYDWGYPCDLQWKMMEIFVNRVSTVPSDRSFERIISKNDWTIENVRPNWKQLETSSRSVLSYERRSWNKNCLPVSLFTRFTQFWLLVYNWILNKRKFSNLVLTRNTEDARIRCRYTIGGSKSGPKLYWDPCIIDDRIIWERVGFSKASLFSSIDLMEYWILSDNLHSLYFLVFRFTILTTVSIIDRV